MTLDNKTRQAKRAEAQTLQATVHVGKGGVSGAADELKAQLKARKLVKVRLLQSATHDDGVKAQADALAQAAAADLVEVRGNTAVYWKG